MLCLARRFSNAPQVQVSLAVIKDHGNLDPRVQAALNAFTSSLTEPHRVTTITLQLSAHTSTEVVELARASQYDFILIGHSTLDMNQPATHFYTPSSHNILAHFEHTKTWMPWDKVQVIWRRFAVLASRLEDWRRGVPCA